MPFADEERMTPALLDTDIVSYFLRGNPTVKARAAEYLDEYPTLNYSIFTQYEILSGLRYRDARNQSAKFREFMALNQMVPFTEQSVEIAADIYATLRSQGKIIDDVDILIASIALEKEYTLVTNNTSHFEPIPNLTLENWTQS